MDSMTLTLTWADVALRLGCTVIAGLALGYNRSEHGKAAGIRTTILVALAAAVAMLQVNSLLPLAGRAGDSFVMNDLMRLPLGILTGVGFIGGGAILRRDSLIIGVTTAATLWYVTVIGLCFGGGQIELGAAATVLGLLALSALKWVEQSLRRETCARLSIEIGRGGPAEPELRRRLADAGLRIDEWRMTVSEHGARREFSFELRLIRKPAETAAPATIEALANEPGVARLRWVSLA